VILLVTVAGVVGLILVYTFGPAAKQRRRMVLAQEHAARIESQVYGDARFRHVSFGENTMHDGCFFVRGYVTSEQALADLKHVIEATSPPVPTYFAVRVYPDGVPE